MRISGRRVAWRRAQWLTAIVAALTLVAGIIVGVQLLEPGRGPAPASSAGKAVAVHVVQGRKVPIPVMHAYRPPRVSWPAVATATAQITSTVSESGKVPLAAGPSAGSARAGSLPVWVGPPDAASSPASGHAVTAAYTGDAAVSRVQVSMASHDVATALGVHGTVLSIARADGSSAAGQVHVSIDYASFAGAYGGDYASRLRLVELPACALTTPQLASCRKQTPMPSGSADSVTANRVGADVTLPGVTTAAALTPTSDTTLTAVIRPVAKSSSAVVLAVTSTMSGSGGDYVAEPVSEATEWVKDPSSGAYTYSYPIQVPPVPGGLEPEVALNYDSQSVDGLSSATNNEASWVGDGWDYSPGYIEEEYQTCTGQLTSPSLPIDNDKPTGDLCPATGLNGVMTLSLDGVSSTLVQGSAVWHPEVDNGGTVQADGGYWELTEAGGDEYYFGMNELPGYTSGDQATDSAWTVPDGKYVGDPSTMVWRWNLDYVVDPHGDAIAYFYNTQSNYYAEENGTTGTGEYIQSGTLAKIEYGLRAGDIYGYTPAAEVSFTTTANRQDAPTDLTCAAGAACEQTSPTFWNDDELTGISTESLVGSTLKPADSWALAGSYLATGDKTTAPSLWLSSITRTGEDGASPITLPPTTFAGTALPNRVQTTADKAAGYSLITRFRLTSITNDTGGVTTITYSPADSSCAAGDFDAPDANTTACYPDYWTPPGVTAPVEDWFNLYSVAKVTVADTTGGDPPVVTNYTYAGPAWHDDDDTISRSVTPTWDEWRGYRTVTTETGTAPDPVTETVDTYYQGMSDDEVAVPSGCELNCPVPQSVTLTSSHGDEVLDSDQYAGTLFESIVDDGAGGGEVTDTINLEGTVLDAGTDAAIGVTSYMAGTDQTDTYTTLAGGGTRESTTSYKYNSIGLASEEDMVPDTSQPSESTCTQTGYTNGNPGADDTDWYEVSEILTLTLPGCQSLDSTAGYYTAAEFVSATSSTYDTAQDVTKIQKATAVTVSTFEGQGSDTLTWQTTQAATYDEYGRVLTSTDADSRTTATTYAPATGAEPTSMSVTDPVGLVTTTTYDPARDIPLTVTDPAGGQTTKSYDALGRVTAEWTPGNPASGPAVDTYSYVASNTAPSVTTEKVEEPSGNYLATQTIDDSLGQVREVQQETAAGGTDVTDTAYNSDGSKSLVSAPYCVSGAPSGTLVEAAPADVPSQTGYVYDGDGRVIRQISYALGSETWETDTSYGGNYVTVVPPAGGTSQTTFTDGRGLTTAIWQYHAGVTPSTADPAGDYDQTSYTYTPAQKLATIIDAGGDTWSFTYDLLGNQLTSSSPDAGTTASTYDPAGQLMTITDARGKTTAMTYDADGRMTAKYDTTGGALESTSTEIASWTYDTLAKGQLTSSTSYENGSAYTEEVAGYNPEELPTENETIIPAAQGALAGTYTQAYTYAPDGQETSYTDSAVGGLPAETVTTGYDAAGNPDALTGTSTYVDSLSYTDLGQPLQYRMGTSADPVYITDSWDPETASMAQQDTQTGATQTAVDDLNYTYNDVGDVTSEADTPSGDSAVSDAQCFSYDYLGRLVQAWAQGTTGCVATPSSSAEGGAAPYWDAYAYSTTGNLTGIISTTPVGAVTTTTDTYPAAGAAQSHAVTGQAVTTSSGTTSTSYAYDAAGNLTAVTGTAQDQALTWNDAGQLAQDAVTPAGGTTQDTTYRYDADGNVLLTADPGTTTLYLSDEELALNTSTGTVTGTRYYSIGGFTVAAGTGGVSLAYLAGDQQGTISVAIDSRTLDVTRRYFDPYGNVRGPIPSSFPAGQKGFSGGVDDSATGLIDLGSREYQPGTGSFVSPGPVTSAFNPQELDSYASPFQSGSNGHAKATSGGDQTQASQQVAQGSASPATGGVSLSQENATPTGNGSASDALTGAIVPQVSDGKRPPINDSGPVWNVVASNSGATGWMPSSVDTDELESWVQNFSLTIGIPWFPLSFDISNQELQVRWSLTETQEFLNGVAQSDYFLEVGAQAYVRSEWQIEFGLMISVGPISIPLAETVKSGETPTLYLPSSSCGGWQGPQSSPPSAFHGTCWGAPYTATV
jgi:YD repeat-containing protein